MRSLDFLEENRVEFNKVVGWLKYKYFPLLDNNTVESEAYVAVLKSLDTFNPSKGASVKTWVVHNIKWAVMRIADKEIRRRKREDNYAKGIMIAGNGRPAITREEAKRRKRERTKKFVKNLRVDYMKDKVCEVCGCKDNLEIQHTRGMTISNSLWSISKARRKLYLQYSIIMCRDCVWDQRSPDRHEHGAHTKYCHGCRCDLCRSAHSKYEREQYHKRKAALKGKAAVC